MKEYFKRLQQHSGIEIAILMTILCVLAGGANKNFESVWGGMLFGLCCSIIIWVIVLISNLKK